MRVLVPPGTAVIGQRASLDESEIHHLRVRRAREHDGVEVLDGEGLVGTGLLVRVGSEWMVDIQTAERKTRYPDLILAVAVGDRERFSWMAEKAVELGVTAIVPVETERTGGVATRLRADHLGRLKKVVLEATKQCGAAWAPSVEEPISLRDFAAQPVAGQAWLADPGGSPPPASLDRSPLKVVIGPEGGLTAAERAMLVAAGYRPTTLGANTLRFETAALAAAAAATMARMRGDHA
jgi:16S rRNA (uracil1498-N3)-methyltransferase